MIDDGDNATTVYADFLPSGLRHVEMLTGRVAPPSIVAWESVVRRAEIGGSDGDGNALSAPTRLGLGITNNLVALPT